MSIQPVVRSVVAQNSSAVDLVTAEIRRAILTGALPAGEQFSVRELASQLGVSHIPIREALRRLEGQGLIILKQARSAEVASLTVDDMEAIYRLRLQLEPQLAANAVPLHTAPQLEILAQLLQTTLEGEPEEAWQAHNDFHAALIAPSASEWDLRILETLWTAAERYTHLVFDFTQIPQEEKVRRHKRHALLLDAARQGNAEAMLTELVQHLVVNEDEIRAHLRVIEAAAHHPADSTAPPTAVPTRVHDDLI